MNLAVLGLGIIGSRAAAKLRKNPRHRVRLWSRSPRGLAGQVERIDEAVHDADVISLYLKDASAVRQTMSLLEANTAGSPILVNHSTIDLETTQWLDRRCKELAWSFLDAPFTGSRDAADAGELVYYIGGDEELITKLTPLLLETAKKVIHTGRTGTATILKLVTNLISACSVQAMAEAMATARRHGISADALIDAVGSNACGSPLASMKLPTMAMGDFDTHFSLSNMLKDSRYALELAADLDTPAISAVSQRMEELCEKGLAELDYSALAKPYLDS